MYSWGPLVHSGRPKGTYINDVTQKIPAHFYYPNSRHKMAYPYPLQVRDVIYESPFGSYLVLIPKIVVFNVLKFSMTHWIPGT